MCSCRKGAKTKPIATPKSGVKRGGVKLTIPKRR